YWPPPGSSPLDVSSEASDDVLSSAVLSWSRKAGAAAAVTVAAGAAVCAEVLGASMVRISSTRAIAASRLMPAHGTGQAGTSALWSLRRAYGSCRVVLPGADVRGGRDLVELRLAGQLDQAGVLGAPALLEPRDDLVLAGRVGGADAALVHPL